MANILILGAGAMGSAFSFPCSDNGHKVSLIGTHLEDNFINKIILSNYFHPSLNIKLNKKIKVLKFSSFKDEFQKADLLVLAINSKGIEWSAKEIAKYKNKSVPILMLTKGLSIQNNKYILLADKLQSILSKYKNNNNISAVGGPCLAGGLASRVHSSVIFANKKISIVNKLKKMISTDYYHISTTSDIIGVEVCAAIKNIFSMAVGASEGLCSNIISNNYKKTNYLNTAASIVRQSIHEMEVFTKFLKGRRETVIGLAGLGDLYVSSAGGRNSKMGKYLGYGMTYSNAKSKKMPNDTVEGAELAFEIGKKVNIDFSIKELPLMLAIINTIYKNKKLKIQWKYFKENYNEKK